MKLLKNIMILMTTMVVLQTNAATCNNQKEQLCADALNKAIKLIEEQKTVINIDDALIKQQAAYNDLLIKEVNKQKEELESPYRNTLLMILTGFAIGVVVK